MSTNRADGESPTAEAEDDGSYDEVSYPVLLLQFTLVVLFLVMLLGWSYFTATAIFDPKRTYAEFFWALPAVAGVGAAFLLTSLVDRVVR